LCPLSARKMSRIYSRRMYLWTYHTVEVTERKGMTVDLTREEAKEVALALRHFYDASAEHPNSTEHALSIYVGVVAKLQDALKLSQTPWEGPEKYER